MAKNDNPENTGAANPNPADMVRTGIYKKLGTLARACAYVQKDAENKEQKYKYASAEAILEKVNAALTEVGLISIPKYSLISEKEKPTAKGAIWQLILLQLDLQIVDIDTGDFITVTSLGAGADPGDKAPAKAQTMALKYAWITALNIAIGDDPEADPGTDRQTFTAQGPPPGQYAPPPAEYGLPPGLPNSQTVYTICNNWRRLGWDINGLASYISTRYSKPADQALEAELLVVLNESIQYLRERGVSA